MGVQLYLEIIDDDTNGEDLIDRFVINVSVPAGIEPQRGDYMGIFGLAEIDLSFAIRCKSTFTGPNCDRSPLDNRTSSPADTKDTNKHLTIIISTSVIIVFIILIIILTFLGAYCKIKSKKKKRSNKLTNVDDIQTSPNIGYLQSFEMTTNAVYRSQRNVEASSLHDNNEYEMVPGYSKANVLCPNESLDYFVHPGNEEQEVRRFIKKIKITSIDKDDVQ